MDYSKIRNIKEFCQKNGIRPTKKLGQNFLINEAIVEKIIAAGELSSKDTVLEIGPGLGVLTRVLVKTGAKVVAVEKDKKLFKFLTTNNSQLTTNKKLKIINGDVLKLPITSYQLPVTYKLISNLPYSITSPVLWKFLYEINLPLTPSFVRRGRLRPEMMVVMVQKEVGERMCAQPGQMSILSVLCQFYAECKIVAQVKKGNFWPMPGVDSVIIRIKIQESRFKNIDEKKFFEMVKVGFGQKRKMLKNNLTRLRQGFGGQENGLKIPENKVVLALEKANLSQKVRAEELSVENWKNVLLAL